MRDLRPEDRSDEIPDGATHLRGTLLADESGGRDVSASVELSEVAPELVFDEEYRLYRITDEFDTIDPLWCLVEVDGEGVEKPIQIGRGTVDSDGLVPSIDELTDGTILSQLDDDLVEGVRKVTVRHINERVRETLDNGGASLHGNVLYSGLDVNSHTHYEAARVAEREGFPDGAHRGHAHAVIATICRSESPAVLRKPTDDGSYVVVFGARAEIDRPDPWVVDYAVEVTDGLFTDVPVMAAVRAMHDNDHGADEIADALDIDDKEARERRQKIADQLG